MERRSFTYMCLTVCESHPVASFLQALLGVPPRSDGIMFFITPRPKRDAPAFLFPATFQQFIRYKNLTLFFFFLFPFLLTAKSLFVCTEWRKMERALEFLRLERSRWLIGVMFSLGNFILGSEHVGLSSCDVQVTPSPCFDRPCFLVTQKSDVGGIYFCSHGLGRSSTAIRSFI